MEKIDQLLKNELNNVAIDYDAPHIFVEEVIVEKGFAYTGDDHGDDGEVF